MENSSYAPTRFDMYNKGHGLVIISIFYKLVLITIIICASQGPRVLNKVSTEQTDTPQGNRTHSIFRTGLTPQHQVL
jgi:hypothetical protein